MKVQLELSYRDLTMVYTNENWFVILYTEVTVSMVLNIPQAGFNPPGEKWQLCLNIVGA